METIVKALAVVAMIGGLCLFTPVGDLLVFLLEKIGLHVGRRYGLKATIATPPANAPMAIGSQGRALSHLRPSGIAEIAGQRCDVIAKEKSIGPGTEVHVCRIEGNRIYVEPQISEQHVGQVLSEAAPSASPDEPST
jgi:membrane-bound ClpP family serine protease